MTEYNDGRRRWKIQNLRYPRVSFPTKMKYVHHYDSTMQIETLLVI